MSFTSFRLHGAVLKTLKDLKIDEPNPIQRQVMRALSEGRDVMVNAPLKDQAEKAALIVAADALAREATLAGTKVVVLTSDDARAEKLGKWAGKLVSDIPEAAVEVLSASQDSKEQLASLSRGSAVVISTPEALRQLLGEYRIVLRGLMFLVMENAGKFDPIGGVGELLTNMPGGYRRVIQASRPGQEFLEASAEWMRDPVRIEPGATDAEAGDAPNGGDAAAETGVTAAAELSEEAGDAGDADGADGGDGADRSDSADTAPLNEIPEGLAYRYAIVPDHVQIQAAALLIAQAPESRTLAYVMGGSESDGLFRELRERNIPSMSVHSRLRRQTYQYRVGRFADGELSIGIIGGNLKSDRRPDSLSRVLFSYIPNREGTFRSHLGRIGYASSLPEVVFVVQASQEEEFMNWVRETGLDAQPMEIPGTKDLKAPERPAQTAHVRPSTQAPQTYQQRSTQSEARSQGQRQGQEPRHEQPRRDESRRDQGRRDEGRRDEGRRDDRRRNEGRRDEGRRDEGRREGRRDDGRSSRSSRHGRQDQQRQGRGQGRDERQRGRESAPEAQRSTPYGLPVPSYDRLERGKSGKKEKKGIMGLLGRMFGK